MWLVGSLAIGANLVFGAAYAERIYPGVKVGATDLSGMTRTQALAALREQVAKYRLELHIDSRVYNVTPSELGANYELSPTLDAAMKIGRDQLVPLLSLLKKSQLQPISLAYRLDRVQLRQFVERITAEQAEAPVDAAVSVKDGATSVTPDKPGLGVDKNQLTDLLQAGIDTQVSSLQVRRSPVQADVTVSEASGAAETAKQLVSTPITLTYNDKKFTPSLAETGGWLRFTKNDSGVLVVDFDLDKVKAYIASSVASGINVAAVTKKVNVVNGEVKSEEGGTDGLAVSQDALAKTIVANLAAKITGDIPVPTEKISYKTAYNRTADLGEGKYIEINLTTQHLWVYDARKVVFESPVTSGATGYGFATVQGQFAIQAKETNRYLDGRQMRYGYYVHVDYWMPFYGDYGLHDASWRSAFGGDDYYMNGSHGCVNLPHATAEWLYNWASVGTPVWVHV